MQGSPGPEASYNAWSSSECTGDRWTVSERGLPKEKKGEGREKRDGDREEERTQSPASIILLSLH